MFSVKPKKSRKPIVGAGSIILALLLSYAAYLATASPLASATMAGLPTYIAPAYYAWRRDPYKSYASAVLAAMVSGSIAWMILAVNGARLSNGPSPGVPFIAGLFTAGFASHLAATAYFTSLLGSINGPGGIAFWSAFSFLASAGATSLGLVIVFSLKNIRSLATPSVIIIAGASIFFLAISILEQ